MINNKSQNHLLLQKEKRSGTIVCRAKPTSMWLESTSRCNLRCISCPRTYLPFFKGKDLYEEVFVTVKEELFPFLSQIQLESFGEPMLSTRFEYLMHEAIISNIQVKFCTNGMFLNEKWIRKFLEHDISFSISIDGARAQTMKKIRPGTDLQKIIKSIELFNKLKEKEYPDSKSSIRILSLALKSNIEEMSELITLANRLKIDDIFIRQLIYSLVHPLRIRKELLKYYKNMANRNFLASKKKAEELGVNLSVKLFDTEPSEKSNDKLSPKNAAYRFPQKCFVPWERILVRVNGDITPCCSSGEIMGNIHKDGFWKVWNGRKYKYFRRRINTNLPPLDCRNCVQLYGINQGNADNSKHHENTSQRTYYFFERQKKLLRYGYHYLKNYI
jgi:radical SAM protein with 4Fe4S-binding SPASM domain